MRRSGIQDPDTTTAKQRPGRADGEGWVRYALRNVVEELLLLLVYAAVLVLGVVAGYLAAGGVGMLVGIVVGLLACGALRLALLVAGVRVWRREILPGSRAEARR